MGWTKKHSLCSTSQTVMCLGCWRMAACSYFRMRKIERVRGICPLSTPKKCVPRSQRTTAGPVLIESSWLASCGVGLGKGCYLVDPASSHMLVSKIKPCMCKYELIQTVKLRMAHQISYSVFDGTCNSDNRSNSRANTCNKPRLLEGMHLLDKRSTRALPVVAMIHDNSTDRTALVPATHHSNFCPINFRW